MLPETALGERIPCSSKGHAPDLLAHVRGSGTGRLVLLGHLDTVISHDGHAAISEDGDRLTGSGSIDMKGGLAVALGVMRELARREEAFELLAFLVVTDEEWRTDEFAHGPRFANFDACLCFEAGERVGAGEGVIVRRKAAGALQVRAKGRASHAGAAPDDGANALLALAHAAESLAAWHDPHGPGRLTVVPTVIHAGDAINVVPAAGELICDLRADSLEVFEEVLRDVPRHHREVSLEASMLRRWPGMDTREATAALLGRAGELAGAGVLALERGGASDASHLAAHVPVTVDGLGPIGGGAHAPHEHVLRSSIRPRAAVALAVAAAALGA
jgi:glutamate carboxypeptidase